MRNTNIRKRKEQKWHLEKANEIMNDFIKINEGVLIEIKESDNPFMKFVNYYPFISENLDFYDKRWLNYCNSQKHNKKRVTVPSKDLLRDKMQYLLVAFFCIDCYEMNNFTLKEFFPNETCDSDVITTINDMICVKFQEKESKKSKNIEKPKKSYFLKIYEQVLLDASLVKGLLRLRKS